jgi:hypothetical protein
MAFSEDLFELDYSSMMHQNRDSFSQNEAAWVATSSKVQQVRETVNDLMLSRVCSSKRTNKVFSPVDSRRSSLAVRRMSSLSDLSQELISSVNETLEKVDSFEFNIFELDNMVGSSTLHYLAHEVFDRFDFFDELVDENKYRSFIREIISGYDRDVVYHNDLHAGDVMQTVYMMLKHGDLEKVYYIYISKK